MIKIMKKTSTCHVPVNTSSPCKDYGNDAYAWNITKHHWIFSVTSSNDISSFMC